MFSILFRTILTVHFYKKHFISVEILTRWDYLVPLSATVFVTFSLAAVFDREASHMGDWV